MTIMGSAERDRFEGDGVEEETTYEQRKLFDDGVEARKIGCSVYDSPWPWGTRQRAYWTRGWTDEDACQSEGKE